MRNDGIVNTTELRKAISQLKADGELFEVRIMGERIKPISGYFTDVETLIKAFDTVDLRSTNVYITLNPPLDALYSRQQADKLIAAKQTTSDKEIAWYEWLFIDLDPIRPTGISSTDEELQAAAEMAQKVYVYLKGLGFEEPVKAFSGNGYHLLYAIKIGNTTENSQLIERCLKALSNMFSDEKVKVDTANYNPSRICKLYGTLAQKGSNTKARPHRMSRIDGDIKELKLTSRIYLEKLAGEIPAEPIKPAQYNNYAPSEFDIIDFMNEHGLTYKTQSGDGCTIYRLDECPFDSSHRNGDSKIFHYNNGAIAFKCHHDSCSGKKWQDVRMKYEPDAYEKQSEDFDRAIEEGWKRHNRDRKKKEINVENGAIWETPLQVIAKPTPDNEYIKTHITVIDKKMHGLLKGGISLWSGLRASAKSTVLSQIALQAVNDNHNVIFYSGELTDKRFVRWLIQQAAGKQYVTEYNKDDSKFYFVPDEIKKQIANWIGDRLFIYNNSYGSNYHGLMTKIEEKIQQDKPDLIVLDNLMTIDIQELDLNEYRAQTALMVHLADLAKKYNVHIALVAHPRKTISFLRLMDVSGSANISNLVDSAFIIHRVNHDFKKGYLDEFCKKGTKEEDVPLFNGTNVIEIAKDREEGIQDEFIPLWYEIESRRMLNNQTEVIKYKWTSEWAEQEQNDQFMEEVPWT
jgi:archaellum biogenesis ATPase FlaH